MGKSKVEAPDFGPLAEILKQSSQYSYELAKKQQAWAEKTYADNKQIGDQITDFAMGQMDKIASWADDDRKRYEDIYQPLEEQQALRAQEYNTPEKQESEAGLAEARVADEFDSARKAAAQRLESFGVDPSQTQQGALDLGTRLAEAQAQVGAGNAARHQVEQYGDQLMANAVNAGKGYPQQVLGAAGAAGASGNQGVNTGLAVTQSGANTMGTGNTWQQLGNQGVGMWGQMLQAQNQADIGTAQANNAASSGIGSAIGGLAGLAMMAAEGGAIPDDEMAEGETGMSVPVEASPSGGAIEDDVPAQMPNGGPARLNAGEFVMPKDVVEWLGEKGMQQIILKARKEMGSPDKAPAQPEVGTPPGAPPTPPRGVGAIPELEDAA